MLSVATLTQLQQLRRICRWKHNVMMFRDVALGLKLNFKLIFGLPKIESTVLVYPVSRNYMMMSETTFTSLSSLFNQSRFVSYFL